MVIYFFVLAFFLIPVTIRAYLSLKSGKTPLPHFQNNIVVNTIKARKALGVFSPILFWTFHVFFLLYALNEEAWLVVLALVVYMVVNPMLSAQIKAKAIGVIPEVAVPVNPDA